MAFIDEAIRSEPNRNDPKRIETNGLRASKSADRPMKLKRGDAKRRDPNRNDPKRIETNGLRASKSADRPQAKPDSSRNEPIRNDAIRSEATRNETRRNDMFPRNPDIDHDADVIHNLLTELKEGELLTYEDMSRAIGCDIRGARKSALRKALRKAEDDGAWFMAIRNEGYRRLTNEEMAQAHSKAVAHIRRTGRKDTKRLKSVRAAELDQSGRSSLAASLVENLLMERVTSRESRKKLLAAADASHGPLPTAKAMRHILGDGDAS